jgi:hypothetical protein
VGGRYAVTMHPALIVLVYALAVARVTRLVTADKITERLRTRLMVTLWARTIPAEEAGIYAARRYPGHDAGHESTLQLGQVQKVMAIERMQDEAEAPLPVYLLGCPWCASIYVAAVAAPLAYFWGASPWLFVPALALAFSYVTGFLAGKE